jgi:hypothetical protein
MADLGDVTALLASMANSACYPNGAASPTVTGGTKDIKVNEGWPIPEYLDPMIAAGQTAVTVFPMRLSAPAVFQVLNETYVLTPAVHGLSATISGGAVTVTGTPGAAEYLTITADGQNSYSRVGASVAAILAAIATDAAANYSGVTVVGGNITFPTTRLSVQIGASATLGLVTHRQRQPVMVTVWAPTPTLRNTVAAAIDVALKAVNHLTFPDTSQGLLTASHSEQRDERQVASIYRRDLVFNVDYATLQTFQGWEVTSVNPTVDTGATPTTYSIG